MRKVGKSLRGNREGASYLLESSWAMFLLGAALVFPLFEISQILLEQRGLQLGAAAAATSLAAPESAARNILGKRAPSTFDWYRWDVLADGRLAARQLASRMPEGSIPGQCQLANARCEARARSVDMRPQQISWRPNTEYLEKMLKKELALHLGRVPKIGCRNKGCLEYQVRRISDSRGQEGYQLNFTYYSPSSPMLAKVLQNRDSLRLQGSAWQPLQEEILQGSLRVAQPDGVEKYDGP